MADPFAKIDAKLKSVAQISYEMAKPVLEIGERILKEGNRRKVLSGLDGNGKPMVPVKYRTGLAIKNKYRGGPNNKNFGVNKYPAKGLNFKGVKSGDPHANGNLTTAEYKQLTGPPLAPRGEKSRVIANVKTANGQVDGTFWVTKAFVDIMDRKGRFFINAHFTGKGKLPKRDLRGTDPIEQQEWRDAISQWIKLILSGAIK